MSRSEAACPVRSKTRHAAHTRQFQAADHGHPGAFSNLPLAGRFNSHSHEGGFVLNDCFRHARTTATGVVGSWQHRGAVVRTPRKQTLVNHDMRHTLAIRMGIFGAFPGPRRHASGTFGAEIRGSRGTALARIVPNSLTVQGLTLPAQGAYRATTAQVCRFLGSKPFPNRRRGNDFDPDSALREQI